MKKAFILFVTLIMCAVMTGCGGVKNAATIAGAGTATYQSFNTVYDIVKNNSDAFSPRDWERLHDAGNALTEVKAEVYAIAAQRGSALNMVADLPELIPLYEKARHNYIIANNIVMSELDEFCKGDQVVLCAFQSECLRFDAAIVDALNAGGTGNAQTVRDILAFVILVGKFAIPLLIL
jgi:uncharacterized protein YceK